MNQELRTVAITGTASGMGAVTQKLLAGMGYRTIGIDLKNALVMADLGDPNGRRQAVDAIKHECHDGLDGLVTFAALAGSSDRAGSEVVSVNYFGTVELLIGLRDLLASNGAASAIAIVSNSMTTQPGLPLNVVEACLAGDEKGARELADQAGSIATYPASKLAVARWVRRNAVTPDWIGQNIALNAIAPGLTDTPMAEEARQDPTIGPLIDAFPPPAGRACRPEEIGGFVGFLLEGSVRYACGSIFYLDGGTDAQYCADAWPAPLL
ncbi:MAG: SDR family oxidoreductase [Acidimicrobiales bacterium]